MYEIEIAASVGSGVGSAHGGPGSAEEGSLRKGRRVSGDYLAEPTSSSPCNLL
jgi:hypothetical protein